MTDATKPARDGRGWLERNLALVTTPAILLLFLVAWTAYVQHYKVSRYLLPEPLAIGRALLDLVRQPYFHDAVLVTASEVLTGFAIAIAAGATLGVAIGKSRLFERVVSPFIVASQVTPKVALMPLFLLWLGFGVQSKIAMVALLSFFPIMKATILGVRSIQPDQRALFAVIRAPWWKRIVSLEVPAVMPYMLTGIETASVLAVTGAIVGEYLGGNEGLGALVVKTLNALMVEHMFATVIALACLGFAFYGAITSIRRFAVPWHESSIDDE